MNQGKLLAVSTVVMSTTSQTRFQVGDWVQSLHDLFDSDAADSPLAARRNHVGHVVEVLNDGEGTVTVFFERSGRATVCGEGDIKLLGDAETGRKQ